MKNVQHGIQKTLTILERVITKMEREEVNKAILKEIPAMTLSLFGIQGQMKLKELYLDNRLAGKDEKESLDISTRLVTRSFRDNKIVLLKVITKELKSLLKKKSEFYPDETLPEYWGPERDDIPIIEDFDEQPEEEKVEDDDKVKKAEEGDSKMILGRPFTFSGGKWVPENGGGSKKEPKEGEGANDTEEDMNITEEDEARSQLYDLGYSEEDIEAFDGTASEMLEEQEFMDDEEDFEAEEMRMEEMTNVLMENGYSNDDIDLMAEEDIEDLYNELSSTPE